MTPDRPRVTCAYVALTFPSTGPLHQRDCPCSAINDSCTTCPDKYTPEALVYIYAIIISDKKLRGQGKIRLSDTASHLQLPTGASEQIYLTPETVGREGRTHFLEPNLAFASFDIISSF